MWVYINLNDGETTNRTNFLNGTNRRWFSLFNYPSSNDFHWDWRNTPKVATAYSDYTSITSGVRTGVIRTKVWQHLAVTFDNKRFKVYINGENIIDQAVANVASVADYEADWTILASNNYYFFNDYRIYDHTLSPKEVKELSKALILHYPLNNPYNDTSMPNLLSASQQKGIKTISLKANTTNYGLTACPSTSVVAGQPYLWYVEIRCTQNADKLKSVSIDTNANGGSYTGNDSAHTVNQVSNAALADVKSGKWCKFYCLTTMKSDATNGTIFHSICGQADSDVSVTFEWRNMMLVNSSQLVSFRGASDTKVIDCGIANTYDGVINGKIAVVKDTPRNSNSYQFAGNSYIKVDSYPKPADQITVSWWGKMSNWANYTRACSCTEGGGWNFEANSSKMSFPIYQNGIGYIRGIDSDNLSDIPAGWHYWAASFNNGVVKFYRDGELKNTYTSTSTNGILYANTPLTVGCESPSGSNFIGQLSDFRIYATALSDSDIAELYHTAAIVDNHNNTYAYEYVEEEVHV